MHLNCHPIVGVYNNIVHAKISGKLYATLKRAGTRLTILTMLFYKLKPFRYMLAVMNSCNAHDCILAC